MQVKGALSKYRCSPQAQEAPSPPQFLLVLLFIILLVRGLLSLLFVERLQAPRPQAPPLPALSQGP